MPRAWWIDLVGATRFLTRVPLPDGSEPAGLGAPQPFRRAVRLFPIVGGLVGLLGGVVYAIAVNLGLPDLVGAALGIGAIALATGALHEDGLADTIDGFGGGRTAADKLEIMRDTRIGAYAVVGLVVVLIAKVGALTSLDGLGPVVAAFVCAAATSRAAMPAVMAWSTPARTEGLAAEAGKPAAIPMWTGLGFALLLCVILLTWSGIVAFIIGALAAAAMLWLARRQIGGHTGDVLGATQQVSELAFLLALAAVR